LIINKYGGILMISNYPNYFRTMPMTPEPEPEMPEFDSSDENRQTPMPSPPPMPSPSPFEMAPGSPVQQDVNYTQGYLRTQIGKRVRITYLLGTGTLQDRTGILERVGISYILIRNEETNTKELSDIYSIKFVVIFD
jgi:hypothetical protein